MSFDYLLTKIVNQKLEQSPFRHIEILDFFSAAHFREIINCPEVNLPPAKNDEDLIRRLGTFGYECIQFPGTAQNIDEYLSRRRDKKQFSQTGYTCPELCEGVGMTFRLVDPRSPILKDLGDFFSSATYLSCIADKFKIEVGSTYTDNGLQKYLDGYEISPHPDCRGKALTYMININPAKDSESREFHFHFMALISSRKYVQEYWEQNDCVERCWVPWQWCQTEKMQRKNNSMVLFSPGNDTIHAIRARYDHLATQRTQFYGNLWYKHTADLKTSNWRELVGTAEHDCTRS